MKVCSKCKVEKPYDDYARDSAKKDGRQGYCRDCNKLKSKGHYSKNREDVRNKYFINTYGITTKQYEEMRDAQDGKCWICGTVPNTLFVDHCHTSGAVRGLLCPWCNSGLGFFLDNTEALSNAIKYLERSDK